MRFSQGQCWPPKPLGKLLFSQLRMHRLVWAKKSMSDHRPRAFSSAEVQKAWSGPQRRVPSVGTKSATSATRPRWDSVRSGGSWDSVQGVEPPISILGQKCSPSGRP